MEKCRESIQLAITPQDHLDLQNSLDNCLQITSPPCPPLPRVDHLEMEIARLKTNFDEIGRAHV